MIHCLDLVTIHFILICLPKLYISPRHCWPTSSICYISHHLPSDQRDEYEPVQQHQSMQIVQTHSINISIPHATITMTIHPSIKPINSYQPLPPITATHPTEINQKIKCTKPFTHIRFTPTFHLRYLSYVLLTHRMSGPDSKPFAAASLSCNGPGPFHLRTYLVHGRSDGICDVL